MTEKTLWKARVWFDIVVLAADRTAAYTAARHFAKSECDNGLFEMTDVQAVRSVKAVPDGWHEAHPWGDGGETRTVEEWLSL